MRPELSTIPLVSNLRYQEPMILQNSYQISFPVNYWMQVVSGYTVVTAGDLVFKFEVLWLLVTN